MVSTVAAVDIVGTVAAIAVADGCGLGNLSWINRSQQNREGTWSRKSVSQPRKHFVGVTKQQGRSVNLQPKHYLP